MPVQTRSQTKALLRLDSELEFQKNMLELLKLTISTIDIISKKRKKRREEMIRLFNYVSKNKNKEESPINSREMCFDVLRLVMEKLYLETLYYEYLIELYEKDTDSSDEFLHDKNKKIKQIENDIIYSGHICFKNVCKSIKKRFIPKSQSEKKTFAACVSLIKEFNEKTLKSGLKNNEPINNEFLTQGEYDSLMSDYRVVVKSPNHIVFEYDD